MAKYYLEKEFERMKKYAEGLGIKVRITSIDDGHIAAEWTTDGSEITFFNFKKEGWLNLCLSFIHELSHHIAWVYAGRKSDFKTDEALYNEDKRKIGEKLDKKQRKLIYETEKNDAQYQLVIWNELNLNIPKWRVELERDLDIWIYYQYYLKGEFPYKTDIAVKRKELTKKYKVQNV